MDIEPRLQSITERFVERFGRSPEAIVRAPGRVDLMGIHTDYNEGFVLPVALDVDVIAAGAVRNDGRVTVLSTDMGAESTFSVDSIEHDPAQPWSDYVRGVFFFLADSGRKLSGAEIVLSSTVPIGSGLSSSAALEIATGFLAQTLMGLDIPEVELAMIGRAAENRFVGVSTGIMDQFISRLGRKDHALLIDCRTLGYEHVPLNTEAARIVVCNTRKQRGLVDSEYDQRRNQCLEAVELLSRWLPDVKALRDVTPENLATFGPRLPDVVRKRAEHIVGENARVIEGCEALRAGDFVRFGQLMNASHDSARDLYEVSCPELEAMVAATRSAPGAYSGRLAGAGFGGCAVSLVEPASVNDFTAYVGRKYADSTGRDPEFYVCTAEDGATVLRR